MEVLNQNQRRSALWRLLALGVFIFSLTLVVLYSMYKSFSENGNDDYLKLEQEYQEAQQNREAAESDLKTQIARLKDQLEECEKKRAEPNKQMDILKARLEAKDDEIEQLNRSLTRCEDQLRQFSD